MNITTHRDGQCEMGNVLYYILRQLEKGLYCTDKQNEAVWYSKAQCTKTVVWTRAGFEKFQEPGRNSDLGKEA